MRLGSLVFGITYRHPAVLAKWAATTDHISGGRLLLGVGAGWQLNEHEQYGIELGPPGVRIDRFTEALLVLRGLLRDPVDTVDGAHYRLRDALAEPKPVQDPLPILIGGRGDRMLGVVAEHADEWNMWAGPEPFAERSGALDARCTAIGRDPADDRPFVSGAVVPHRRAGEGRRVDRPRRSRARPSADRSNGSSTPCGAWAEVGVDEVIVPDFTLGTGAQRLERLDLIIEEIAPAFRA